MITPALSRRVLELADAGVEFVTATVVRVQRPTSVSTGSVALVLGDGTIEGFVGGVCAEHSVRAYSLRALERGEPVLLRILPDAAHGDGPDGEEVLVDDDGVVTVQNPCLSGGAIELFLEPALPEPRVLVVGDTPIAAAVVRIGAGLGLDLVAAGGDGPEPAVGDLALVVAAHGRDELHTLRRGLEAGLPYIGLVASPKRGAGVIDELRADGVDEDLLDRIDVPAGIDIGSRTAPEIALSILAQIVAVRRGHAGAARPAASAAPTPGATPDTPATPARGLGATPSATIAIDPVCGMTVAALASTPSLQHEGETVYFCCEGCRTTFQASNRR